MIRRYFMIILVLTVGLFNMAGCGGGSTPLPDAFRIAFICPSTPNTVAAAFETFLETAGHTVDIIAYNDIEAADFSAKDVFIVYGGISWGYSQSSKLYKANKPVITIYAGNQLYDTLDFDLYIGWGHSMGTVQLTGIKVDNASDQFWSTPNSIAVTTGAEVALYSSPGQIAQTLYWSNPPAGVYKIGTNISDPSYSDLCYENKNSIRYFQWGYDGAPATMTSDGQKLFKNVLYWLVNGTI